MIPRPPEYTRTDTLLSYTTLFRCAATRPQLGRYLALTNRDSWHSEDEPRLGAVLGECWHLLCDGAADPQNDFHLAALATQHAGFGCALRTVELRKVDSEARELW